MPKMCRADEYWSEKRKECLPAESVSREKRMGASFFRKLTEEEVPQFIGWAQEHDPDEAGWEVVHPLVYEEWLKLGKLRETCREGEKLVGGRCFQEKTTDAQIEARDAVVHRRGRFPVNEYYSGLLDVYFLVYDDMTYGIEPDGYTHT